MISPHWHPSSDYHRSAFLIGRLHLGMDAKGAKESSLFILFDAGQHCLEIRQVNHFYGAAVIVMKLDGPIHFSSPMPKCVRPTYRATIADRSPELPSLA